MTYGSSPARPCSASAPITPPQSWLPDAKRAYRESDSKPHLVPRVPDPQEDAGVSSFSILNSRSNKILSAVWSGRLIMLPPLPGRGLSVTAPSSPRSNAGRLPALERLAVNTDQSARLGRLAAAGRQEALATDQTLRFIVILLPVGDGSRCRRPCPAARSAAGIVVAPPGAVQ